MSNHEKDGLSRREVLGTGFTAATLAGAGGLAAGGAAVIVAQSQTAQA